MIAEELRRVIRLALNKFGAAADTVPLEHPTIFSHGDFATSAALLYGPRLKQNPKELAQKLVSELSREGISGVEKIEVAGPGFVNFHLASDFLTKEVGSIILAGDNYGRNNALADRKIIIEYTDPNPFKEFHIGHLMSNTIGETLSRLAEWNGAEVRRACYQGDVGLHVAKAIWGVMKSGGRMGSAADLGQAYVSGDLAYGQDPAVRSEIESINRKLYDRNDAELNRLYDQGRKLSLESFEKIYRRLGTKFDFYFFESEASGLGLQAVNNNLGRIFQASDGAIIFRGEEHGLHTRVFVTSQGLPTYEAKELALAKLKYDKYPYDQSIVVTGNEVNDYFKTVLKAMALIFPSLAEKTVHVGHGMIRLPEGKMSSRTGKVITAETLLDDVRKRIAEKVDASRQGEKISSQTIDEVAVGAVKYSILKQAAGRDIIFDFNTAVSFEGDSGPYLQYTHARARRVAERAVKSGIEPKVEDPDRPGDIERLLYRLPDLVRLAEQEHTPQRIAAYAITLAGAFNHYYAETPILDSGSAAPYRVGLAKAVAGVIKNCLTILGIAAPERM